MKRALCVILIISMLLSMLAGCSDGDSQKHDDTTAVDILNIDTTSSDRTGLYQLYWIPLPKGKEMNAEFEGHVIPHNEYEYYNQMFDYIDGEVLPIKDAKGVVSRGAPYVDDSFVSANNTIIVPFAYHSEPHTFYTTTVKDYTTKKENERIISRDGAVRFLRISLDTFDHEMIVPEYLDNEIVMADGVETPPDILKPRPTVDGGIAAFLDSGDTIYYVRWDADGKRTTTINISERIKNPGITEYFPGVSSAADHSDLRGAFFTNQFDYAVRADGNIVIKNRSQVRMISDSGEFLAYAGLTTTALNFELNSNNDGEAYVTYLARKAGGTTRYTCSVLDDTIDMSKNVTELPETLKAMPQLAPGCDAYQVSTAGVQAHFYNEQPVALLNWVDYDLRYEDMLKVEVIDANRIFFIMKDPETGEYRLGLFSAQDVEGHVAEQLNTNKKQLTLAYIESSNVNSAKTIETYVSEFNLKNKNYRVKLLAYKPIGNQTAEDMLVMDIISGKVPDMILFDSDMNYRAFDNLGVCRNLYEFMDKDAVYKRDKFIGAVKKPFENAKGELPYLTILSGISTLVMSKDMADGLDGWTMTELQNFIKSLGKDQYFIDVTTSVSADPAMALLKVLLPNTICHYVDYDSGKSNFGGDLKKMLEICKNTQISQSKNGVEPKNYRDQKVAVLAIGNVATVQTFLRHRYAYYSGAEIAYLGFPTNGDCGSVIVPIASLAITTKSANPDGAWEFIKACLSYQHDEWEYTADPAAAAAENQRIDFNTGFPCVIETVERMCETLEHYFFQFSLSESLNNPGALMVGTSKGGMHFAADGSYGDNLIVNMYKDDVSSTFYSLAEDDAENLLELLNDITMVRSLDGDLLDIIYEDAQYYFNGTKSLEETVRIIENRVGIKLAE